MGDEPFALWIITTSSALLSHLGVDFSAKTSTDIFSVASGEVLLISYTDARGNYIYIKHYDGTRAIYQHNSKNFVSKDDKVEQGQHIAEVGDTGTGSGSHLHFELFVNMPDDLTEDIYE